MKKIYRHKDYDFNNKCFPLDENGNSVVDLQNFPEPEVVSDVSPGSDYEEYNDALYVLNYKASLYPQKAEDGISYSNLMNAKLDLLDSSFFTEAEMNGAKTALNTDEDGVIEAAKDQIDTAFEKTQVFLEGGKWKSAQREITKVNVVGFVKQSTIDEIKLFIDTYVTNHY